MLRLRGCLPSPIKISGDVPEQTASHIW